MTVLKHTPPSRYPLSLFPGARISQYGFLVLYGGMCVCVKGDIVVYPKACLAALYLGIHNVKSNLCLFAPLSHALARSGGLVNKIPELAISKEPPQQLFPTTPIFSTWTCRRLPAHFKQSTPTPTSAPHRDTTRPNYSKATTRPARDCRAPAPSATAPRARSRLR